MVSTRLKVVAAFVAVLGALQIFFEDVVVFLGATGTGSGGILQSRYVMIGVPLLISVLLLLVLVGGALLDTDSFR